LIPQKNTAKEKSTATPSTSKNSLTPKATTNNNNNHNEVI